MATKTKAGLDKERLNYAIQQVEAIHQARERELAKNLEANICAEMAKLGLDHKSLWQLIKSGKVPMKSEAELALLCERNSHVPTSVHPEAKFIERITLIDAFDFSCLASARQRLEEIKVGLNMRDTEAYAKLVARKNDVIEEIVLGDNAAALRLLRAFRREK